MGDYYYPDELNDIEEEDVFVIDSNDRVLARLEEYKEELILKEAKKKEKLLQKFYDSLEYDEEGKPIIPMDEEGYALVPMDDDGNPLVSFDEDGNLILPGDDMEPEGSDEFYEGEGAQERSELSVTAEEIIADAQEQANLILEDANQQAQMMLDQAIEDGRQEGYQQGMAEGMQEYQDKEAALEQEKQAFLAQLNEERASMEAELVDVICDVMDKTFKTMYSGNKGIILHLIDNALLNIENSKVFLIRVNEKNHAFLTEHKATLLQRVGSDAQLDIIMDPLMDENGIMIETDGGIFDCSMDTQMANLITSLKALSI